MWWFHFGWTILLFRLHFFTAWLAHSLACVQTLSFRSSPVASQFAYGSISLVLLCVPQNTLTSINSKPCVWPSLCPQRVQLSSMIQKINSTLPFAWVLDVSWSEMETCSGFSLYVSAFLRLFSFRCCFNLTKTPWILAPEWHSNADTASLSSLCVCSLVSHNVWSCRLRIRRLVFSTSSCCFLHSRLTLHSTKLWCEPPRLWSHGP